MERVEYIISGSCLRGALLGQLHNDANSEHQNWEVELTIGHPTGMATQTYVNSQIAAATHTISDVTGLQTALDSKALDSDVTTAFASISVELSQKVETLKF